MLLTVDPIIISGLQSISEIVNQVNSIVYFLAIDK